MEQLDRELKTWTDQFYLISFSVALLWLHVENVHLASKGGQELQDQTMFGHLQYQHGDVNYMKQGYY